MTIKEAILVEGRYDAHAVRAAVNAVVLETQGFGVFHNTELRTLLRRLAEERGLIALTDADGAGFVIRNHLKGLVPAGQLKHAYIPEIPGRERRKAQASREGLLGVEGMDANTIRTALLRAGATVLDGGADNLPECGEPITKTDFFTWGLSGAADASSRRAAVLRHLGFPQKMTAGALLCALNALYSKEAASKIVETALSQGLAEN